MKDKVKNEGGEWVSGRNTGIASIGPDEMPPALQHKLCTLAIRHVGRMHDNDQQQTDRTDKDVMRASACPRFRLSR